MVAKQPASIAILTIAPALKLNEHFRRQGMFMPVKVLFNFVSSPNEPMVE
jgi:hypothetical protein